MGSVSDSPLHRDRYQHCTFCSVCKAFSSSHPNAVAKCDQCPRILCHKCAGDNGEEVPLAPSADDTIFPACKCPCQSDDSEFPQPRKGKDPQIHLVRHLGRHALSRMFREPVDVEENRRYISTVTREKSMDLSTIKEKLKQKQYPSSSRGQELFRADLKKIWVNCSKYACRVEGGLQRSKDEVAGIVRCANILEAMIQKFYDDREKTQELVGDGESCQPKSGGRREGQFARITRPSSGCSDESASWAAAKSEGESDEETDLEGGVC